MLNLIKVDDVRSGTKANARHGWLRSAQGSMGLNTCDLNTVFDRSIQSKLADMSDTSAVSTCILP